MELNKITEQIIGAAIDVHRELGPGLLESVYQKCLFLALQERGLRVEKEIPVPVRFRGQEIDECGFRMDLLVEDAVVIELKSVDVIHDVHKKQLLTYLRLSGKKLGLLINFNEASLMSGLTRIIN